MANLPKFSTSAEDIARLREFAASIALDLDRPDKMTSRGWKPKRPIDQERLDRRLNAVCTCIELLTINGNYEAERGLARETARKTVG